MPTTDLSTDLHLESLSYPLASAAQQELIQLWRTEWSRTDYDWLEAMNGDYSENLAISSILARRQGEAIATATLHFHRTRPEVAVLGSVLTRCDSRGAGVGSRVIASALAEAQAAGCSLCLLGTARTPRNVYLRHGFTWLNGTVMLRHFGAADFTPRHFASGQPASVRPAEWGDLPGLTLLAAQPLATVCLDHPRGLFSCRYLPADRCLSNFPVLWYDTVTRGGALVVLAAAEPGRILGFGSVTQGMGRGRRHTATIDFSTHDHYTAHQDALLTSLLDACRTRNIHWVEACVAAPDEGKIASLRAADFAELARLPGALRLTSGPAGAILLGRAL